MGSKRRVAARDAGRAPADELVDARPRIPSHGGELQQVKWQRGDQCQRKVTSQIVLPNERAVYDLIATLVIAESKAEDGIKDDDDVAAERERGQVKYARQCGQVKYATQELWQILRSPDL